MKQLGKNPNWQGPKAMVEKTFEFRLSFLQVSNFDTTASPTYLSQLT